MSIDLALVVPTLNEREHLPRLLESAFNQTEPFDDVIIADGGSSDGTPSLAASAGARVVHSTPGRGIQVAAAVKQMTAKAILVLHADVRCDRRTAETIRRHLVDNPNSPGGCLGHRFDCRSLLVRMVEIADRRRARRGVSYGDQGQFFRRDLLDRVGGFPAMPIMEDVELSQRLQRLGMPAYLDLPVLCSRRGFERLGVFGTVLRNHRLRKLYRDRGQAALAEIYRRYYQAPNAATRSTTS